MVNYAYDAWGKPISTTGSMASTLGAVQPFRYRGYLFDQEIGLYYLRSRYYNPVLCRFVNADKSSVTKNRGVCKNIFVYCNNCPNILMDLTGEMAEVAIKLAPSAFAAFSAWLSSVGAANWWNPIGWIVAGILTVGAVTVIGLTLYEQYIEEQLVLEQRKHGENWNKTVKEILKTRQGRILRAPIPLGGPTWEEAMTLTLAEIYHRMQSDPKWHEIYKLLTDNRFAK